MNIGSFWDELRRRHVVRVVVAYAVGAVTVAGGAEVFLSELAPDWVLPTVLWILVLGLPLALALAWAYDFTPDGIVRTVRTVGSSIEDGVAVERDRSAIVVLPFDNMSPDPNDAYFCDGLTEEIISHLSSVDRLRVISRRSAVVLKQAQKDVLTIGRELAARYVLEGSVRKAGADIRITAQLIDATKDEHIWAERYDRKLEDVFAIQDEIASDVVRGVIGEGQLRQQTRLVQQTRDLEAYSAFLRGRFFWNRHTLDGYRKAVESFESALRIDPQYALAYAGVASCYFWMGFIESQPPDDVYPKAKEAASRALEIDDSVAEAHAYLAAVRMVYDWAWAEAEEGFLRAIDLDPHQPVVRQIYSVLLLNMGRLPEALEQNAECLKLDPLWVKAHQDRGYILVLAGRYEEAKEHCRNAIELDPDFPLAQLVLGWAHLHLGEFEDAIQSISAASQLGGDGPIFRASLAAALGYAGKDQEARSILAELTASDAFVPAVPLAWVHIALGEFDLAFELLDQAVSERSSMLLAAPSFSYFDPVRDDPRFRQILDQMGLTRLTQVPERELLARFEPRG